MSNKKKRKSEVAKLSKFGKRKIKELEREFKKDTKRAKKRTEPKKKVSISRKDFEAFEFGVQRLKELERELNSLNTKKFSVEAASIRSKLKDVSQIPIIEKEMKILRQKISGKYPSRRFISGKRVKIDTGIGFLVDSDFNSFLREIKLALSERLKKRGEEIEYHLQKQFDRKYKKALQTQLKKDVGEKFNQKLIKEKAKLETQYKKELKKHVDSEIKKRRVVLNEQFKKRAIEDRKKLMDEFHDAVDREAAKKVSKIKDKIRKQLSDRFEKFEGI